jgi:hypothetical protein
MKQFGIVVILALVITGCQTIPEKPANVSLEFDGIWKGERIITSGSRCLETKIEGSVKNGLAELTLIYNGTLLRGWINQAGKVTFEAYNPNWNYAFSGQVLGNKMAGDWMVDGGLCSGNWHVTKTG